MRKIYKVIGGRLLAVEKGKAVVVDITKKVVGKNRLLEIEVEDVDVGDIVTIGEVTPRQVILKPDEDYFKENKIPYEYALKFAWDMLPDKTSKFNVVMTLPDGFCLIAPTLMEDREMYLLHKDTLVVTTAN